MKRSNFVWVARLSILFIGCFLSACSGTSLLLPTETPRPVNLPTPFLLPALNEPTLSFAMGYNDPTAASLPSGGNMPPRYVTDSESLTGGIGVEITTTRGVLSGELYNNLLNERRPGIMLLAPDRTTWLDLPLRLQSAGYTVLSITVDRQTDSVLEDFQAVLRSLSETGSVDPGQIVVIGALEGADIGLVGCANDLLCDALVMFSPLLQTGLNEAVFRYNPRPMYLVSSTADETVANQIRANARGAVVYEALDGEAGASLIQSSPAITDRLIQWLADTLGS